MTRSLKVLHVCSEVAPLAKTGGLANVANALPLALRALGHDARVIIPCYASIPEDLRGERIGMCVVSLGGETFYGALRRAQLPNTDVPVYLVEHDGYFMRDQLYGYGGNAYDDNLERFCFFSKAVLEGLPPTGWMPDILHCHDWHTAVIPALIKTDYAKNEEWGRTPTVFTIHSMAYQGRYNVTLLPKTGLPPSLFNMECLEYYGGINLMKAGIRYADALNTVSPTYAREIQTPELGHGLDGFLRTRAKDIRGIVNGVDYETWNPATDQATAASYSATQPAGKAVCKSALQKEMGLPPRAVPVFGMVTRLVWEKGIDLVVDAMDAIFRQDVQLVILGNGNDDLHQALVEKAHQYVGKLRVVFGYNDSLARRIYAGSDFFLMPSRTEPCGLSQLYSLAYGAVPVVRQTGGLADTVCNATPANITKGKATGITFASATTTGVADAVRRAVRLYKQQDVIASVRRTGMTADFSWKHSSEEYLCLYDTATAAATKSAIAIAPADE